MKIQDENYIKKFRTPFTYFYSLVGEIKSERLDLTLVLSSKDPTDLTFLKIGDFSLEEYVYNNFNDKLFLVKDETPTQELTNLELIFKNRIMFVGNTSQSYIAATLKKVFEGLLQNVKLVELKF